jgi:hypothetical protein
MTKILMEDGLKCKQMEDELYILTNAGWTDLFMYYRSVLN